MKIKTLSKILTFGILLNNISINSFAGVLSEDGRHETFEESNITINDILEEDKVDIKIEGNSLVNLSDIGSDFEIRNSNAHYVDFTICETSKLKIDTEYTLFIYKELSGNHSENYNHFELGVGNNINHISNHPIIEINNNSGYVYGIQLPFNKAKKEEILKVKIKFKDFKEYKYLSVRPIRRYTDPVSTEYCNANVKILLLEGDYTGEDIDYFKGIKSSFEDQLVTQEMVDSGKEKAENLGKYKVEYKSTGKNLLNTELLDIGKMGQIANKDGQLIILNGTAPENFTNTKTMRINLQTNHKYTMHISSEASGVWGVIRYTVDDFYYYITCNNSSSVTFVPLEDWENIIFYYQINDAGTSFDNIKLYAQIEKGTVKSDYELYKESVNTFYLDSPLLEGDTIEYINGQTYHIRRYGQVVLDGSDDEEWHLNSVSNEELNLKSFYIYIENKKSYGDMLNDKMTKLEKHEWDSCSSVGIFNGVFAFGVISDVATTIDLKEWLKENPTTTVYELDKPIYEPINIDLSASLFEGTTHISNNSTIPTNMVVIVDRTINRATEAIELAKTNPTIENIALARMWVNRMRESILKDEFQDNIGSITKITDMTLERKTTSSSVDVYIKSENLLSMSLNTNSITFEDFSGVDDVEKSNTVNISINSSLPYNLNAYLSTEIQNSDKSKIMDKDILNIKENSEANYQTFNSVDNKVVLQSNCESGNNKQHNIDFKLKGGIAHEKDVYKATIKFEAEQK